MTYFNTESFQAWLNSVSHMICTGYDTLQEGSNPEPLYKTMSGHDFSIHYGPSEHSVKIHNMEDKLLAHTGPNLG